MEQKGLFSVVIPAYNREKTIARSIKSVLDQTYGDLQVIVVDDGSADDTKNAVAVFLTDKRVSYFYQDNAGAQRARNCGLEKSKGEFVIFLDSDDELLPNCLEKMVESFRDDDEIGAVYCRAGVRDDGQLKPMRNDCLKGEIYKAVLEQGFLTSSSFISMRRCIFQNIGNWDEKFPASQDDDMCFRIAKKYKVGFIDEILGIYYFDAGKGKQISSSPIRVANGWWLLWNKYENDVVKNCGKAIAREHFVKCAIRFRKCDNKVGYEESVIKIKKYSSLLYYWLSLVKIECAILIYTLKRTIK